MKINLNWINRNTNEDGTRVFRETTPFSSTDGLTPIATLPQGANSYTDENVVKGTLYYYRLEVFKGDDVYLGNQVAITALDYTGPGPQTLSKGDYERGYFGEVEAADLYSGDELALRVGLTAGTPVNSLTNWLKFAHKGKVLFIPKLPIRYTLDWNTLFNLGIVYGDNSEVPATLPSGAVASTSQGKQVELNGDRFVVRLMKGMSTNPAAYTPNSDYSDVLNGNADGSEWHDLIYSICNTVPASQSWGNFLNLPDVSILGTGSPVQMTTLCQELATAAANSVVVRGGTYVTNSAVIGGIAAPSPTANTINSTMGGFAANRQICWRPVLEFLP